jgi:hypothetical protein
MIVHFIQQLTQMLSERGLKFGRAWDKPAALLGQKAFYLLF